MIAQFLILVLVNEVLSCNSPEYLQENDYDSQDFNSQSNEVFNETDRLAPRRRAARCGQANVSNVSNELPSDDVLKVEIPAADPVETDTYNDADRKVLRSLTQKDMMTNNIDSNSTMEVNIGEQTTTTRADVITSFTPTRINKTEDKSMTTTVNYPFSVSLQRKGAHYASGALLDKRWILTTAAEFYNVREELKLYRARVGSIDCKRGGTLLPLMKVEVHPSYVPGNPAYDISLIMMAYPVEYSDYIRPIRVSKIEAKVLSAKFLTTYWPRLIINGQVLPQTAKERTLYNSMRVSTQRLIPWDKCSEILLVTNDTLHESSLCLKPVVTHHSPCLPDVGAPVVAEDGLWGITSGWLSRNCTMNPSPTICTRVSLPAVRSWLSVHQLALN